MSDEPTRMMTTSTQAEQTLLAAPSSDPMRTQMGGTTVCPVCHTTTPLLENYCTECGFLLSSPAPQSEAMPEEEIPPAALVDVNTGRKYPLRLGENTVGRHGTDVLLLDNTVSRTHARIRVENGQVLVEDLGSTNGTKVGDQRLAPNQPMPATNGTVIRFGNLHLRLEVLGGGTAEKTVAISMPSSSEATLLASPAEPEETQQPVAFLRKIEGLGDDLPLTAGVLRIGRRPSNDLVIASDPYVSGSHAEIRIKDREAWLTDVGSTNGTFVNGTRLLPNQLQLLVSDDEVRIGQTSYRFEWVEETATPDDASAVVSEPEEGLQAN